MSKIKELVNLLGLNIGEVFKIKKVIPSYKILEDGIYMRGEGREWVKAPSEILINLVFNPDRICKAPKPWKPEIGEPWYRPRINRFDDLDTLYEEGLLCKTKEEADQLYAKLVAYARRLRGF